MKTLHTPFKRAHLRRAQVLSTTAHSALPSCIQRLEPRMLLAFAPIDAPFRVASSPPNGDSTSVAYDADGNFVVAWTGRDASLYGILARRYDASGQPLGPEFVVNTTTLGSQFGPAIAMNPNGDFVIAWESGDAAGPTGSDIYAQRFGSSGLPLGNQFRANTTTDQQQRNAAVAIDSDGDFVIAWQSYGSPLTPDVFAQRYNAAGEAQGNQFRVNNATAGLQRYPAVAMNDQEIIFTWFSSADPTAFAAINARRYSAAGQSLGNEFQVNSLTAHPYTEPSVAMFGPGEFVIAWWAQAQGQGAAVRARQYDAAGQPIAPEFTVANRAHPIATLANGAVVIDWLQDSMLKRIINAHSTPASGRFVRAWGDDNGVFAQRFHEFSNPASVGNFIWNDLNTNGIQDSGEGGRANVTIQLLNQFGVFIDSTTTTSDGSYRLDNLRPGDSYYLQLLLPPDLALAAPNQGPSDSIDSDFDPATLRSPLFTPTPDEVNLTLDAGLIPAASISGNKFGDRNQDGIRNLTEFGLPGRTIFLDRDSDGLLDPNEPSTLTNSAGDFSFTGLPPGLYRVAEIGQDPATRTTPASGFHTISLTHGQNATGLIFGAYISGLPSPTGPAFPLAAIPSYDSHARVAMDADGDSVVTWIRQGTRDTESYFDIYAQRYNRAGQPVGGEFQVNTSAEGTFSDPAIAIDSEADFVIAWASPTGIFAQRFNASAQPLGPEFPVNTTANKPSSPSVAVDSDGDFVISWTGLWDLPTTTVPSVFAQRYNAAGQPLGGEFRANNTIPGTTVTSSVAMDADGDFVIAWDGERYGYIYSYCYITGRVAARRYNAAGEAQGDEISVSQYGYNHSLAMDADGDFTIGWTGSGCYGAPDGTFYRRYSTDAIPQGPPIQTTDHHRADCPIAMDADGELIAACTYAYDPDVDVRRFSATDAPRGDWVRVYSSNYFFNQRPTVTAAAGGDFIVSWAAYQEQQQTFALFAQRFDVEPAITSWAFLAQTSPHRLRLRFSDHIQSSLSASDLLLQRLGPSGGSVALSNLTYDPATDTATFSFADHAILPDGNYRVTIASDAIHDSDLKPLAAPLSFDFFFLSSDLNHDRSVTISDFIDLGSNFNKNNATYSEGDINYDGIVSIADFIDLAAKFNTTLQQPSLMPVAQAAAASELPINRSANEQTQDENEDGVALNTKHHKSLSLKPAPSRQQTHHRRRSSGFRSARPRIDWPIRAPWDQ